MQIKSLELRARAVMEGISGGMHRSPYHGFSVEFTEYRQYSPGDDLRYLDWRLYARNDRYYIKRFEDETNLRCQLLLDMSRSMDYGSGTFTKADYARTLSASLAFFLASQRDAVGLVTFDDEIREFLPARYRPGHLRRLLHALETPVDGTATDLALPLAHIAERLTKRGMFVLISDMLAPIDELEANLSYLCAQRHEVLVFQILDPSELDFGFDEPALVRDGESGQELYVDPAEVREFYVQEFNAHMARIRTTCDRLGIQFHQVLTTTPLESVLGDFLRSRMHGTTRSARTVQRSRRAV